MKSDMRISRTSFFSEGGIQKDFAWLLSIAISYMIGVRIGLFFRVESIGMATIWPPSGIALAALILSEKKKWVWVILVIFASNVFGNLLGDNSLLISLGFALANITESLVCAFILTFFLGSAITFSRMTEVCVLIGIALFANAIIALLGASIPALAFGAQFFDTWLVWWIADGLGIILVTPFLIVWLTNPNILQNLTARRLIEAIILLFIISAASWLPFDTSIAEKIPYFRYYMIFPLLIWMTFRFSQRSVLTMVLLFVVILLAMSLKGQFVSGLTDQQVRILILSIQILFIIVTITVLILTAVIYERKLAEAALSKSE
ncbi:MASE1 domain-containing protein, partial [bacterium]|nr:MASE1 domain-containing protein [bacterium]